MRGNIILTAVLLICSTGAYAGGLGPPPFSGGEGGNATSNATGVGVGVGIGKGGNAYAGGGDASAVGVNTNVNSNKAYGGNASSYSGVKNNNANIGVNKQGQLQGQKQGQGQEQGQSQSNYGSNKQGQIGINKATGSGNSTTIRSNTKVEAEPAIAPSVFGAVSHSTCFANIGASGAGGGIVSIGINGWKEDHQCTARANTDVVKRVYGSGVAQDYARAYIRGLDEVLEARENGTAETASIEVDETGVPKYVLEDETTVSQKSVAASQNTRTNVHNPYGL